MQYADFLKSEDERNITGRHFFERFLKRAVGPNVVVIVAHHIVFIGDDGMPNEIPSADTLLFNPTLMKAVFGVKAEAIMMTLCHRTPELRDRVLNDFLDMLDLEEKEKVGTTTPGVTA